MSYFGETTNYNVDGVDVGANVVTKEYIIDTYPSLSNQFKTAGLWLSGQNSVWQLGDNTEINKSSPVMTIAMGSNWKSVAGGGDMTIALKTDGTIWSWGYNNSGQLSDNTRTHRSSPVQSIATATDWRSIAAGESHAAAIDQSGQLWVWGWNLYGQLGDGTRTSRSSPVQTVASGTTWECVELGYAHSVAVKSDGRLWAWGWNSDGRLGDNTTTHRSSPVQTVAGGTNWRKCVTGTYTTAGIKSDGTLWLWGENSYGCLGNNSTIDRSSPVQTVSGGTTWKEVSIGWGHAAAIKTDGTLWSWGRNSWGQLGDGVRTHRSSPVQTISAGTNWKQVCCLYGATSAIKTDGTLWVWGDNSYGQLGDGSTSMRSSPVQTISGGSNWKFVGGGGYTLCAIRDDSTDPF